MKCSTNVSPRGFLEHIRRLLQLLIFDRGETEAPLLASLCRDPALLFLPVLLFRTSDFLNTSLKTVGMTNAPHTQLPHPSHPRQATLYNGLCQGQAATAPRALSFAFDQVKCSIHHSHTLGLPKPSVLGDTVADYLPNHLP